MSTSIKIRYKPPHKSSFRKFVKDHLGQNSEYHELHTYLKQYIHCAGCGAKDYLRIMADLTQEYTPPTSATPQQEKWRKVGATRQILDQASKAYLEYVIYYGSK